MKLSVVYLTIILAKASTNGQQLGTNTGTDTIPQLLRRAPAVESSSGSAPESVSGPMPTPALFTPAVASPPSTVADIIGAPTGNNVFSSFGTDECVDVEDEDFDKNTSVSTLAHDCHSMQYDTRVSCSYPHFLLIVIRITM